MRSKLLRYDASNMGSFDISETRLAKAKQSLLDDWKSGRQGWLGCPDEKAWTTASGRPYDTRFTAYLVIGIGGSDVGARALWHALKNSHNPIEFAGGNTDPDELTETLKRLDWKRTLVNVISKSGDTLEPMAAFFVVRDILRKKIGKRFAEHIVATTDENGGALRELARREGYATLSIPTNVSGRFSVLTNVGLFPMRCAGFDVRALLRGARQIRDTFLRQSATKNDACRYAAALVAHHLDHHRNLHVLMPYSERLRVFTTWVRQLWAESLGKKGIGPTPIAALGATDQHSQIQLYTEGPDDKVVTFIEVERFATRLAVPRTIRAVQKLDFLAGTSFEKIIHAERAGTASALAKLKRPNGTLFIPRVDEASLGALIMFFQIATGIAGELYGVNAYDQPGVEEGKRAMIHILRNGL